MYNKYNIKLNLTVIFVHVFYLSPLLIMGLSDIYSVITIIANQIGIFTGKFNSKGISRKKLNVLCVILLKKYI